MNDLMKLADEYAEAVGRYVSNKATLGEVADARTALLSCSESAHAQGFAAGAASQLAEKPSAWSYKQNRVHSCLQFFCPPDDAYDEGTLIELYTRREA